MNWIIGFFALSFIAVFTSQSLVDLSDVLITFGALIMAFKRQELKELFTQFKPALFWPAWLSVMIISLFLNIGFSNAPAWKEFLEFRWILSFLAILYLVSRGPDLKTILKIISPIVLILNIAAVIFYMRHPEQRAGGIMNAIMPFSHNIAMVLCLYFFMLFAEDEIFFSRNKIMNFIIVLTSAYLTLATMTRGVWIGSAVGVLVASLMWNWKMFVKMLAGISVVVTIVLLMNQSIYNRLFSKTEIEATSNSERMALWRGNWRIIQDNPVWGVGFAQNRNHLRKYYDEMGYPEGQRISHAHNQYLQVWGGTGTIGFIFYLTFLCFLIFYIRRSYKMSSDSFNKMAILGLYAATICFLVGSMTEANFNIAKNRFFFLLLVGMAIGRGLGSRAMAPSKN